MWAHVIVMCMCVSVYLLVTMMTSSAIFDISLMARYTSRRRDTSFDWKSLVVAKNTSVASVEFIVVPCGKKIVNGHTIFPESRLNFYLVQYTENFC